MHAEGMLGGFAVLGSHKQLFWFWFRLTLMCRDWLVVDWSSMVLCISECSFKTSMLKIQSPWWTLSSGHDVDFRRKGLQVNETCSRKEPWKPCTTCLVPWPWGEGFCAPTNSHQDTFPGHRPKHSGTSQSWGKTFKNVSQNKTFLFINW